MFYERNTFNRDFTGNLKYTFNMLNEIKYFLYCIFNQVWKIIVDTKRHVHVRHNTSQDVHSRVTLYYVLLWSMRVDFTQIIQGYFLGNKVAPGWFG